MRFISLRDQTGYDDARALQLSLVEDRIAGKIPDTTLFLEHRAVITRGRGLQKKSQDGDQARIRHMPFVPPQGNAIEVADSERGGDLTYHGPGQLVIYPIVKLDGTGFGSHHDVEGHIRRMERILTEVLSEFRLDGESRAEATGVWVGPRKVASIGIAVRKWVTYHGMAVNVVNDLEPFHLISPCGFSPEVMTRLADLSPEFSNAWSAEGWRPWLERKLAGKIAALSGAEADSSTIESRDYSELMSSASN